MCHRRWMTPGRAVLLEAAMAAERDDDLDRYVDLLRLPPKYGAPRICDRRWSNGLRAHQRVRLCMK